MRSKIIRKIIAETPPQIHKFVSKHTDIVLRIHELLEAKGMTQKDLAEKLSKRPSEISKWLGGGHNFTLRTISKLEVALDAEIIVVPKTHVIPVTGSIRRTFTVIRSIDKKETSNFTMVPKQEIVDGMDSKIP